MFKYSDDEFIQHIEKIESSKSLNELQNILKHSLGFQSYVIQILHAHTGSQQKNYVALSNAMPQVLLDFLHTNCSREAGPIGKLMLEKGQPLWFSDIIQKPDLIAAAHKKNAQGLFKLTGDGIFVPSYYKNHWSVTLITFGKSKNTCSSLLLWQTETLYHQVHIRYRNLRDQFKNKVNLTNRETDVIDLLTLGKTNSEIALILDIKPSTVSTYVKNIYLKLGVTNRVTASLRAMFLGLGS